MTASPADPAARIAALVAGWIDDPDNPVVYTEMVDGKRAVRVQQETRDFTTVWIEVGERSIRFEAYVIPAGDLPHELLRQCLVRNRWTWRTRFCLDEQDGIVLRARLAVEHADRDEIGFVMAELYEQIEVSFRPMVRALSNRNEAG